MFDNFRAPTFRHITIDITPTEALPLAGYEGAPRISDAVDDRLEANLIIVDRDLKPSLIVASIDTLFIDEAFRDALASALQLPPWRLVLVATHTHNAPALNLETPRLGKMARNYHDYVISRISEGIARTDVRQMRQSYSSFAIPGPFGISRRKPAWVLDYPALKRRALPKLRKKVAMTSNRKGYTDSVLRALVFRSSERIEAVIWSVAAHPAFYPKKKAVSADFPGTVRSRLRSALGENIPVLYFPGFAGDAVPLFRASLPRSMRELTIRCLPAFPTLPAFTGKSYDKYCSRLAKALLDHVLGVSDYERIEKIALSVGEAVPLCDVTNPSSSRVLLNMTMLRLNETFLVSILSGEPVAEWRRLLNATQAEIMTGYAAGRPTYIPTSGQMAEGGYEVEGFRKAFGIEPEFARDMPQRLIAAFRKLAETVG